MANWQAKQCCPNLIIVPPQYDYYLKFSKYLHGIYKRYTDQVEPFGMDECWLDITGSHYLFGSSEKIANDIREAVKKVGAEHIILETDCPYLSPQGKRGQRNDPSNIPLIAQFVADYLDISLEELAEITTRNARALYGTH